MNKLGLAFMCKGETDELRRMLKSLDGLHFDQVVVNWNGTNEESLKILIDFGCEIYPYTWKDDFCDARKFIWDKLQTDLKMFIDCDDELKHASDWNKIISETFSDPDVRALYTPYEYLTDSAGNKIFHHDRERVVRANFHEWEGGIHAVLHPKREGRDVFTQAISVKHNYVWSKERFIRNRDWMQKEWEANPSARSEMLYGVSLMDCYEFEKAKPHLELAVKITTDKDYRYYSMMFLCDIYIHEKNWHKALRVLEDAIELCPGIGGAYFKKAKIYECLGQWDEVIKLCEYGFYQDMPPALIPFNHYDYTLLPAISYCNALTLKKEFVSAYKVCEHALKTFTDNKWLNEMKNLLSHSIMKGVLRNEPSQKICMS